MKFGGLGIFFMIGIAYFSFFFSNWVAQPDLQCISENIVELFWSCHLPGIRGDMRSVRPGTHLQTSVALLPRSWFQGWSQFPFWAQCQDKLVFHRSWCLIPPSTPPPAKKTVSSVSTWARWPLHKEKGSSQPQTGHLPGTTCMHL